MLRSSLIAGLAAALALPVLVQQAPAQQDSSSQQQKPPSQTSKPPQQKKDQPKKSAAQANPFPQAQSEAAAHQGQQQNPDAPTPQPTPKTDSSGKPASQNPFPEEQSKKAAHESEQTPKPTPDSEAPPGEPSYSSSHVKGLDMPTTDEQPPGNLPPSQLPYDPKLARKDANIGDWYMESGNWKGAYDRFLEAHQSDPGNAEAVFGLAESAHHLRMDDVALPNYRLYLSALPNGPHAKQIHKALKQMGAEP